MISRALIVVIICSFIGCGSGSSDFIEELKGGYYFYSMGGSQQFIAPKVWKDETPIIPSKVIKYEISNDFILAKREIIYDAKYYRELAERGAIASVAYDYWILNTSNKQVIGPINGEDFMGYLKRMNIVFNDSFPIDCGIEALSESESTSTAPSESAPAKTPEEE